MTYLIAPIRAKLSSRNRLLAICHRATRCANTEPASAGWRGPPVGRRQILRIGPICTGDELWQLLVKGAGGHLGKHPGEKAGAGDFGDETDEIQRPERRPQIAPLPLRSRGAHLGSRSGLPPLGGPHSLCLLVAVQEGAIRGVAAVWLIRLPTELSQRGHRICLVAAAWDGHC